MRLFHIANRAAWDHARSLGVYAPPSLVSEGFIHLSLERQWLATANRFYRGQPDLVLLQIDAAKLRSDVRHEPADGDYFPHLYGPLHVDAVDTVHTLVLDGAGAILPLRPVSA